MSHIKYWMMAGLTLALTLALAGCEKVSAPYAEGGGGGSGGATSNPSTDQDAATSNDGMGVYPNGPYGFEISDTIADLTFISAQNTVFKLSQLRTQQSELIVWSSGTAWCIACDEQTQALQAITDKYTDQQVQVVESLYQAEDFSDASAADALQWSIDRDISYPVLAEVPLYYPPEIARAADPWVWIIRAKDMVIMDIAVGATAGLQSIVEQALFNARL